MLQLIVLIAIIAGSIALWYYLIGGFSQGSRSSPFKNIKQDLRVPPLRREILKRISPETAERLIASERMKNPGKSEQWYLEKVLYDLKRGR